MILIVDALATGRGGRKVTLDVIGAGPRTIAGVLEKNNVDTKIAPAEIYHRLGEIPGVFKTLMISGMITDMFSIKKLIGKWRRSRGDAPVVVGGPITAGASLLSDIDADILVYGEAEKTLEDLVTRTGLPEGVLDEQDLSKVAGIIYKTRDGVRRNKPRPFLSPDMLSRYRPSASRIRDYPGYWYKRVYVEVVRGCSNLKPSLEALILPGAGRPGRLYPGCAYCSVPGLWGGSRSMSIERVREEVEALVEEGVRRVVLSGPDILDYGREGFFPHKRMALDPNNPPANTDKLESLFSALYEISEIRRGRAHLFIENVKPCLVDEEVGALLGRFFRSTSFNMGVEAADDDYLRIVGRPCGYKKALEALRILKKHGLRPHIYLIYGLPGQHPGIIRKTIRELPRLRELGVEKITLYRFTPIPYSLFEKAEPYNPWHKHNKLLKDEVRAYNLEVKKTYIGKTVEAVITNLEGGVYWGYMWPEGPVIKVPRKNKPERSPLGRINKVRITRIHSDRVLEGEMISYGRRISLKDTWGEKQYS